MILDKAIIWNNKKIRIVYSLILGNRLGDMNLYYEKLGEFLSDRKTQDKALESKDPMEFMNVFLKGDKNG